MIRNRFPDQGETPTYKEQLIRKLQSKISKQVDKKNQYKKNQQYMQKLEQQYKHLQQQKKKASQEFTYQFENSIQAIKTLEKQLQTLRRNSKSKNHELSELAHENKYFTQQIAKRNLHIQNLNKDGEILKQRAQQLITEENTLQNQFLQYKKHLIELKQQKLFLQVNIKKSKEEEQKLKQNLKNIAKETKIIYSQVVRFQNQNNTIDGELEQLVNEEEKTEAEIIPHKRQNLRKLQYKIIELQKIKNHTQSLITTRTQEFKIQKQKQNEIKKNMKQKQQLLYKLNSQIIHQNEEAAFVSTQNNKLTQINHKLENDLETLKKHFQNLVKVNQKLSIAVKDFKNQDANLNTIIQTRKQPFGQSPLIQKNHYKFSRTTLQNSPIVSLE